MQKNSYNYDELISCGEGKLFGEGNAKLPLPPMLMFDRITEIKKDTGEFKKGFIKAELDIKDNLWFFDCHFKKDPVMPGCLGLDAMWQLVGFYLGWIGEPGKGRALGVNSVKFTGEVLKNIKMATYEINMKRILKKEGTAVGLANGILSFRLQGQALILTLGVGFFVKGGVQILVAMGTFSAGTVFGVVPDWMRNIAAMNGKTVGLPIPPIILIWIVVSIIIIVALRLTKWGRNLYALGGSRLSSARLSISERGYWVGAYVISGFFSALTGALLLGWSGGGFIGVGDTYLFLTIAAVVIGGTSLLGGYGGYGLSVIGVLILQIITTVLVGWGLSWQGQQFILGLLIIPMVALYARSPHIRTQI